MANGRFDGRSRSAPLLGALAFALAPVAPAQIVLDGSLGASGLMPGPNVVIDETDGRLVGSNLFHSFSEFNVLAGQSATFTGPDAVANILGRVTGGLASTIDGMLRSTIPDADLFIMNPVGVVFGPSAELDVGGGLHVTSASYIRLEDGTRFDATPGAGDALLSTAPPAAFGFLDDQPGAIRVHGSGSDLGQIFFGLNGMAVAQGEALSVIGGEVEVAAGTIFGLPFQARLLAPGGRIDIVSVAGAGEVVISAAGPHAGGVTRLGAVDISQGSRLDVSSAAGAGAVHIRAGALTLDNAFLVAGGATTGPGGTIHVEAGPHGAVDVSRGSVIDASGLGGGDVVVSAGRITADDSDVLANTRGEEPAGALTFRADEIRVTGGTLLATTGAGGGTHLLRADSILLDASLLDARTAGPIAAGVIELNAQELSLVDGAQITVSTLGAGAGGEVRLVAPGELNVVGESATGFRSAVFADSGQMFGATVLGGEGDAGAVIVRAGAVSLEGGTSITADALGSGRGGRVDVEATGSIALSGMNADGNGSVISASAASAAPGSGAGGTVEIAAADLLITHGGRIDVDSSGTGRGGQATLDVTERVLLSGSGSGISGASLGTMSDAGDAGTLRVTAGRIELADGASIVAGTAGPGAGGQVHIATTRDVTLRGSPSAGAPSRIVLDSGMTGIAPAGAAALGDAGRLELEAGSLQLEDGTFVTADSYGAGRGGDLTLHIAGAARLAGESALGRGALLQTTTRSTIDGAGAGGTIDLAAGSLSLSNGAQINTFSAGPGDAGDVAIRVDGELALTGTSTAPTIDEAFISAIFSLSAGQSDNAGDSGSILIEAGTLSVNDGAQISTEALGPGSAGPIVIDVRGSVRLAGQNLGGLGGRIDTAARGRSVGAGGSGSIALVAGELRVLDGAQISATTFGPGSGGGVSVGAANGVFIAGTDRQGFQSGIFAASRGSGDSGAARIQARAVDVRDGGFIAADATMAGLGGTVEVVAERIDVGPAGRISTSSTGAGDAGDAGDIVLRARDALTLDGGVIRTSALVADGGNVDIDAGRLVYLLDSAITTSVESGEGSGGNIDIDPDFVILNRSRIEANAFGGPGGNVRIVAGNFIVSPDSVISASSQLGVDGIIVIESPDEDISGEISTLPTEFVSTPVVLLEPCAERSGADVIRLSSRRYEVLPDSPYALRSHHPGPTAMARGPTIAKENDGAGTPAVELPFMASATGCSADTRRPG